MPKLVILREQYYHQDSCNSFHRRHFQCRKRATVAIVGKSSSRKNWLNDGPDWWPMLGPIVGPILHDRPCERNRRRCYQSSRLATGPSRWKQFRRCKEIGRRNRARTRNHPDFARCAFLGVGRTILREHWPVSN